MIGKIIKGLEEEAFKQHKENNIYKHVNVYLQVVDRLTTGACYLNSRI